MNTCYKRQVSANLGSCKSCELITKNSKSPELLRQIKRPINNFETASGAHLQSFRQYSQIGLFRIAPKKLINFNQAKGVPPPWSFFSRNLTPESSFSHCSATRLSTLLAQLFILSLPSLRTSSMSMASTSSAERMVSLLLGSSAKERIDKIEPFASDGNPALLEEEVDPQ